MTPVLPLLLAQAVICGQYGATPSTPGGCTVPYPTGGGAYLQQVNGQLWSTPLPQTPYQSTPTNPTFPPAWQVITQP